MGLTQSCYKEDTVEKHVTEIAPSILYTLHFICSSKPINKYEKSLEKVLYTEQWCQNESIWKTYINNALKEIEVEQGADRNPVKRATVNRLKIYTKVHGNIVIGNVKWYSSDVDVSVLNNKIHENDENFYEKGMYFIEPFWTTCIIPRYVVKSQIVNVD